MKVADLFEFWRGQKEIVLLDANILACKDRMELLAQLVASKARVDFTQGLDARFITRGVAEALKRIRKKAVHFAFDFMENEQAIVRGLTVYKEVCGATDHDTVYILTNYNTTVAEDLYRVRTVEKAGFYPDVRIYRKSTAPRILRDLQRWANNRRIYRATSFMDYIPRADGKTIRELYFS